MCAHARFYECACDGERRVRHARSVVAEKDLKVGILPGNVKDETTIVAVVFDGGTRPTAVARAVHCHFSRDNVLRKNEIKTIF